MSGQTNTSGGSYGGMFTALGQSGFGIGGKVFAKKESHKARRWAQRMRATHYQTTVNDMRAAGLNPIMAANGSFGLSAAPTGAQAQSTPGTDPGGAASAIDVARAQVRNLNAQTEKTQNEADMTEIMSSFLAGLNSGGAAGKLGEILNNFIMGDGDSSPAKDKAQDLFEILINRGNDIYSTAKEATTDAFESGGNTLDKLERYYEKQKRHNEEFRKKHQNKR